jgi:hypothetical protein
VAGQERHVLRAGKIGLRARDEADVAVLHAELYEDIVTRLQADSRPWRLVSAGSAASLYAVSEPRDDHAVFSVVELASGELAGGTLTTPGRATDCDAVRLGPARAATRAQHREPAPGQASG